MFKKMLLTTAACAMMVTSAFATTNFYEDSVGYWSIWGHPGDASQNLNKACIVSMKWDDGSTFLLIQDLVDGELLIEVNNNEWNIEGPYEDEAGQLELTLNMYKGRDGVTSTAAYFTLLDKNTIQIRGIDYKKFLPNFMGMDRALFIMPGTIQNAEIPLQNSAKAIQSMTNCMDAGEKSVPLDKFEKQKPKATGPEQGA
jgi:hypothetical protein